MSRRLLLLALVGCAVDPVAEEAPEPADQVAYDLPLPPIYRIRIHAIATADDDGDNASPVTATTLANRLAALNAIFSPSRIAIEYDAATDYEFRESTLLNQRFTVTVDLDDWTSDDPPPTTREAHDAARRAAADEHPDKITIFFARPNELKQVDGVWTLARQRAGGSSSRYGRSVAWRGDFGVADLAHEIGHYLHNEHTMREMASVLDASSAIRAYIADGHPADDGLLAFDPDRDYVRDTPPDAGDTIFEQAFGDECDPDNTELAIPVTQLDGSIRMYMVAPDRTLVMSYFKGCGGDRFSRDQTTRIYDALAFGNRRGVVDFTPPSATPILAPLGEDTAGTIAKVKLARIDTNRVVTATTGATGVLKLIAWDIGPSGTVTRRGDVSVGDAIGPFEVVYGGLDQVVVAYQGTSGGLVLKSYAVSSGGTLTLLDTDLASSITDLGLARIAPTVLVTPVRLPSGVLRVIAWTIDAYGSLARVTHEDGGVIDSIEGVTAFHAGASEDDGKIAGGVTTHQRVGGNLAVQAWKVQYSPAWAIEAEDTDSAGTTGSAAASDLDFDLAATTVRGTGNVQKVIAWQTGYGGAITRRGSATTTLECGAVASAAIHTRFLVTACRGADYSTDLRLFEVSPRGATVTQRHARFHGTAKELALAPVGHDKVVLATATATGALKLSVYGLAP